MSIRNPAPLTTGILTNTHILVGNASNIATDVALSGDATLSNTGAMTLATVNANTGSFGSSTSIPTVTLDAKGRVTAASGNAVIAPAGTLTGTTLAANVVTSTLSAVDTITTGTWNATTIALNHGGTGQTTKAPAFDALQPMTTGGDIIYGGTSGTGTRLANGSSGQTLTSGGGTAAPTWSNAPVVLAGSDVGATVAAGATVFFPLFGSSQGSATRSNVQIPIALAGTIKNFYVNTISTQSAGGTLVFTVEKNAVATSVTCSYSASHVAAVASDTTNSFTVAAGDLLSLKLVNNGSGTSAGLAGWSMQLLP